MSFAFCAGVVLQHVKLVSFEKANELAGPSNLVRVRNTIKVRGLYTPSMASYLFASAGGAATFGPLFRPGVSAPATEVAVQYALQRPRQPFAFVANGILVIFGPKPITFLQTPLGPKPGAQPQIGGVGLLANVLNLPIPEPDITPVIKQKFGITDCANGPLCRANVLENIGDKTFVCEWEITTWTNDAPTPKAPFPGATPGKKGAIQYPTSPLLAQEYSMVHTIDQDFFTTRQVEGRAIFRSDVLQVLELFPDQLRYWLGHPIPQNFSRSQIQVRAESDNLTLAYRFIDQQRVLNFDPNVFTRVELTISKDDEQLGLESILRTGIGTALNTFMPITRVAQGVAGAIPVFGGMASGLVGAAGAVGMGWLTAQLAGVEVTHYTVQGRFWGHPDRFRREFENDAFEMFQALIREYAIETEMENPLNITGVTNIPSSIEFANPIPENLRIPGTILSGPTITLPVPAPLGGLQVQTADVRRRRRADISGMFVEYEHHTIGSRLQTLFNNLQPIPEPIPGIDPGGDPQFTNPPPPRSVEPRPLLPDPMQGTYLGGCVANALRDSADLWEQVQEPPPVRNQPITRLHTRSRVDGITLP